MAGTWKLITNQPPASVDTMLLLTDGTVVAHESDQPRWHRLTPDASGNYEKGTWSSIAPMIDTRLFFSSQILKDGRV